MSFHVNNGRPYAVTLTSGFFASKTLGLDLNPMEAKSNYGMRDEQENYKYKTASTAHTLIFRIRVL